jgi:hypothetical protein
MTKANAHEGEQAKRMYQYSNTLTQVWESESH